MSEINNYEYSREYICRESVLTFIEILKAINEKIGYPSRVEKALSEELQRVIDYCAKLPSIKVGEKRNLGEAEI